MLKKSELEQLYTAELNGLETCAAHFKMSHCAFRNAMIALGIPRRSSDAASTVTAMKRPDLTQHQTDLILGSLLGDACISFPEGKRGVRAHRITFAHCAAQLPYLEHKQQVLNGSRICPRYADPAHLRNPEKHFGGQIFQFVFQHKFGLQRLVKKASLITGPGLSWARRSSGEIHKFPKTVTEDWAALLNPRAIAYWYQDDGGIVPSQSRLVFNTNSFTEAEINLLRKALRRECNLDSKICDKKDKGKIYKILQAYGKYNITSFCKQIDEHVVPCLKYKLSILPEYAHHTVPESNRPAAA